MLLKIIWMIINVIFFIPGINGLSVKESCGRNLGLEDGRIKDYQLTASSSYQPSLVGPNNGRLNTEAGGGAWCPKSQIENAVEGAEYLEIDLLTDHIISSILIQGRYGNGLGQEFAEFFAFEYRSSIDQQYIRYTDQSGISVLPANINTFQVTQYNLSKIVVADAVRIFPLSEYPRTVCLRVELTGCPYSGNLLAILMDASGGGLEDLEQLYPQSRSEETSIKLYLAIAIGIFVTVICASIAAVAIAIYRSRIQSRKPFSTTSQYNFVSGASARDSSIPSDDPSMMNGHVTLINNSLDYGYVGGSNRLMGTSLTGGGQRSMETAERSTKNSLLTNGITTTITTARSATAGGSISGYNNSTRQVTHLPPMGNYVGVQIQQQQPLEGHNTNRTRSRSVRPRIPGGGISGNYVLRRSSLDERTGSGGSVSSARSAESVTRPVENTEQNHKKPNNNRRKKDVLPKLHNGFRDKGDVIRFPLQKPSSSKPSFGRRSRVQVPLTSDEE